MILLVNADTGDSDAESLPSEVQGATPDPGSVALPQDVVSVDLRDDLTGELWIDGLPIPDDQLEPLTGMKLKLNALSGMVRVGVASRIAALMDASRPIGVPLTLCC